MVEADEAALAAVPDDAFGLGVGEERGGAEHVGPVVPVRHAVRHGGSGEDRHGVRDVAQHRLHGRLGHRVGRGRDGGERPQDGFTAPVVRAGRPISPRRDTG